MPQALFVCMVFVLTVGCGQNNSNRYVEPELEQYVQDFESVYGVITFRVQFSDDLKGTTLGNCLLTSSPINNVVSVRRDWFEANRLNYYAVHQLIFHELGHCAFGLEHDDRHDEHGPLSIMSTYALDAAYYFENFEYFRGEFLRILNMEPNAR